MAKLNNITAVQLMFLLTASVCIAAIFEPRLKKACIGLLCRLT